LVIANFIICANLGDCRSGNIFFPLVSSVVYDLSHSFRVWFMIFPTRFEWGLAYIPLNGFRNPESLDITDNSQLVWLRCLLHSFRVWFPIFSTPLECVFTSSPLVSSVVLHLLHSFRVWFHIFSTRFECVFSRDHKGNMPYEQTRVRSLGAEIIDGRVMGRPFTLETSVVWYLLHSKRVKFMYLLHSKRV
jgi:hypothetical protein